MNKKEQTILEEAAYKYSREADDIENRSDVITGFLAGAEWQAKQMPMPEDTVLFQKGVAEGRRLEKDDVMKDLPKWKKNVGALRYGILEDEHGRYIQHDGYKLYFDDLLKLPKEDQK